MTCTLCDHSAHRKVGVKGYCQFHAKDAFRAQAKVLERYDEKWADHEKARKRKDYQQLANLSAKGCAHVRVGG